MTFRGNAGLPYYSYFKMKISDKQLMEEFILNLANQGIVQEWELKLAMKNMTAFHLWTFYPFKIEFYS